MEQIKQVLSEYGLQLLGTVLTALATYLGLIAKKYANKILGLKNFRKLWKLLLKCSQKKVLNVPMLS